MTAPLQQFIHDLKMFSDDLRELFSAGYWRNTLSGNLQDLRQDRKRQLSLLFTIAVHLGAMLLSLAGPLLLTSKVRIPEIYRVELYNAVEVPAEVAPPAPAPAPVIKPPPAPVKVEVKQPVAPAPAAKPKVVSLSPIKQRLLKEQKDREDRERQARLLDLRMDQLKLERQRQEAEEEARQAASQAVNKIADLYRSTPAPTAATTDKPVLPARTAPAQTGSSGPNPQQLEALERYRARLFQHIKPNWQLPDLQNWDENLTATIVIKMKWDGSVDNTWLEKKSGDYRFDQYVQKAIDNSLPLPPLPLEFDRKSEEIAVTFTPGGLR